MSMNVQSDYFFCLHTMSVVGRAVPLRTSFSQRRSETLGLVPFLRHGISSPCSENSLNHRCSRGLWAGESSSTRAAVSQMLSAASALACKTHCGMTWLT